MNLLFLSPYAPSPLRTRPYNFLRALAAAGHSVTLATTWSNETDRAELQALEGAGIKVRARRLTRAEVAANVLAGLASSDPIQMRYSWSQGLMADLKETYFSNGRAPFDVVHVEHLRGARYGLFLKYSLPSSFPSSFPLPPIIWDSVDSISLLFEQSAHHSRAFVGRMMTRFELGRTRRAEGQLARTFSHVLVSSAEDCARLRELAGSPEARITALPNGVDLARFHPEWNAREPDTVVFSGKLSYHANDTAARYLLEEVMPRVWAQKPGARLRLVGAGPGRALRRLARDAAGQVEVTGYVGDLAAELNRATVAVAPLVYAVGIQNKVLEAMACGLPVVASPVAVRALDARDGQDVIVADGPQATADAILRLLNDEPLRRRLGEAGRAYVERHHNWTEITKQLVEIYQDEIARAVRSQPA